MTASGDQSSIPGLGKGNGARFGVADGAQPLTHMRSRPGKPRVRRTREVRISGSDKLRAVWGSGCWGKPLIKMSLVLLPQVLVLSLIELQPVTALKVLPLG